MAAAPETRDAQLAVIQEAIDRRRQGGISPQIEQQTSAAGPPVTGEAPPIAPTDILAQRAGAPTGTAPAPEAAPTEESPEETKIVVQMLLKRLQSLLKTGGGSPTGAA